MNEIMKTILEDHNLTKHGLYAADVFFYLAGRFPELTVKQAVEVVKLARKACADNPD